MDILTPEDIIDIRSRFIAIYEPQFHLEIEKFRHAVETFMETSQHVYWMARILTDLTEGTFEPPEGLRSLESLREAFEEQAQSKDAWVGLDVARNFLDSSPYRVWSIYDTLLTVGKDVLDENLIFMVGGSLAQDINRVVENAYWQELQRIVIKATAAKEQEESWKGFPIPVD